MKRTEVLCKAIVSLKQDPRFNIYLDALTKDFEGAVRLASLPTATKYDSGRLGTYMSLADTIEKADETHKQFEEKRKDNEHTSTPVGVEV